MKLYFNKKEWGSTKNIVPLHGNIINNKILKIMRKTTTLLSMLFAFVLLNAQNNLLKNSSFEEWVDGKPTNWTLKVNKSTVTEEATTVLDGTKSLKMVAPVANKTSSITQEIDIVAGKTYELTMSYYIETGDGTDARIWCGFKLGKGFVDMENPLSGQLRGPNNKYFPDEKGTWKTYTVTFTAPTGVDKFIFEFRQYKGSTVYWDKMSLIEKGGVATPTISLSKDALTFMANVGDTSPAQSVNVLVANLTEAPTYSISGVDATSFSATGTLTQADGGTIDLTFSPIGDGEKTAILTVVADGQSKTVTLTGTATNNSNPYGLDVSNPLIELNETFGDGTATTLPTSWKNIAVKGSDKTWQTKSYGNNNYMQMSAHKGTGTYQTLLISPAIDFDKIDRSSISFDWKSNYTNGATLNVYVMDKEGKKTEVKVIDDNHPKGWAANYTKEVLDLSAHTGILFLVFEYNGDATAPRTTTYQLDNVVVNKTSTSSLSAVRMTELNLWKNGDNILFNASSNDVVTVYNAVGQVIYNASATDGLNSVTPSAKGLLIVKVGQRISKIIF